jgi:hypothetical protein
MEKRGLGWRTVQLVIGVISRPGIGDLLKTSHPTGFRQRLMQLRKEYQSVLCRRRRRIAASHRQQNIRFPTLQRRRRRKTKSHTPSSH